LQRSFGTERERTIREAILSMHGVASVAKLKTFRAGQNAVVIAKITTRLGSAAQDLMRKALAPRISETLREAGCGEAKCYLRFERPDPVPTRVAFAISKKERIAASLADAVWLRISDVEDGLPVRCKDIEKPDGTDATIAHLVRKRVTLLYASAHSDEEARACAARGIARLVVESDDPAHYDLA
jgi:hypothetical protein